jgi:hypothetical protein
MNTLQKIIAGAAIVGASMFGYNANAQVKPTKIATETSIVSNKDVTGVPMQRLQIGNDAWTFKYDHNFQLNNTSKPSDVGMFALNKLYNKNNTIIGAEIFPVGNYDKNQIWFVDAWISKKVGNIDLMLDYGKGFQKDKHSKDYVIATLKHPKFSVEGCLYPQGSLLDMNVEWKKYGFVSYKGDHVYASVGNKIHTTYALVGTSGLENFGNFTYINHNRETGDISLKSQTSLYGANQKFFQNSTFEMASEYFAMPAYFPIKLSPMSNKGAVAVKLEYKKTPSKGTQETEIMVGSNKTPFVQVGLGVNTEYKNNSSISNVAIELYKEVKFGKFTGSVEARYNARTSTATGYVKMNYTF